MNSLLNLEIIPTASNLVFIALTTSFIILLTFCFKRIYLKQNHLPPGPFALPILGNLLQMIQNPHLKFSQWANQYGKLCTIYLGPKPTVLVSDPKLLKDLFSTNASTGNFQTDSLILLTQGPYGIVSTEGDVWVEQRQFCERGLKEIGYRSSAFTGPVFVQEAQEICQWIKNKNFEIKCPQPMRIDLVLYQASVNILWEMMAGKRFEFGDAEITRLLENVEESFHGTVRTGLAFFPWLKYLAPKLSGYLAFNQACSDLHNFVKKKFDEHQLTFIEGETRDLIDIYIEQIRKTIKSEENNDRKVSSFGGEDGVKHCISSLVLLIMAGGLAISETVHWALIYLANNLDIQNRIHSEIDEIIGKEKDPSIHDRERMPFTEATIDETYRMSSLGPFGIIHQLVDDIKYDEYTLPKGTLLAPNLYHIHHNSDIWGDPLNFRPERFFENRSLVKECLFPFQTGKRQCMGENIGRHAVFIYIVKLMQEFHVSYDPSIPRTEYLKPIVGYLLKPKPFGLIMTPR